MYNEAMGERNSVVGLFGPRVIATAAQTVYADVVDMSKFRRAMVIAAAISTGTAAVKGLTVKLYDCEASGTAASTAFYTSAVTRVNATAGNQSIVVAECKAEDLGQYGAGLVSGSGRYFKAGITTSTIVRSAYTVIVLGGDARFGPGSDSDISDVKTIGQA